MVKIRGEEPTFEEIIAEAFKNEHLDMDTLKKIKRDIRLAPWLPQLYVGYDHALKETSAVSISDNINVNTSGVVVGPTESDLDRTFNNGKTIHLRAMWSLGEILFHPARLSAGREGRELSRDRIELNDHLYKIYSERRQLQGQYLMLVGTSNPEKFFVLERLESVTERLDAYTEGFFRDRWRRFE